MVQWITENKCEFERQTMLAFAAKDRDLDSWLSSIDSNSVPGDEFFLLALCQMYKRHAILVTSMRIWTTIHSQYEFTDHDLRRKCDLHLIYLGGTSFGILKPKFEWKVDVPIGHVEMVEPPAKTLQDTTDDILDRESNENNIKPKPVELVDPVCEPNIELQEATRTQQELLDATCNLLVQLPDDMQLDIPDVPHPDQEGIKPRIIKLQRCDIVPCCRSTAASIEVNVIVNNP